MGNKITRDTHVPVRITTAEKDLIQQIATERSTSVSSVIRWAISNSLGGNANGRVPEIDTYGVVDYRLRNIHLELSKLIDAVKRIDGTSDAAISYLIDASRLIESSREVIERSGREKFSHILTSEL